MLKSKKIVDWLYDYSLYFIIGALLLVIIAIEPSFVRVSNFTTILTWPSAVKSAGPPLWLLRFCRQSITPSAFSALTRFPHCR